MEKRHTLMNLLKSRQQELVYCQKKKAIPAFHNRILELKTKVIPEIKNEIKELNSQGVKANG